MQRVMLALAGLVWFGLLFLVTFWLTFPSDAVVARARWEVADRSGGAYSLDLSDLGPWWLGASAQDVKLFSVSRDESTLAFMAKDVRASVSPFSLLSRAPAVSGSVTPLDGTLYFDVGTVRSEKKGDLKVRSVRLDGDDFPLAELLLLAGVDATGTGGLDIAVDVDSDDGLKSANGDITVSGKGLGLDDVEIPGVGALGRPVPIDDLNLVVKVSDGQATLQRAEILSPLLKANMTGVVALRDTLDRSSLNVEIVVSDLGEEFAAFSMMLRDADAGNGRYKFSCTGTVASPRCSMGDARASSRVRPTSRPTSRPTTATRPDLEAAGSEPVPVDRPDSDELRKRREERLERLRQLREERMAERPAEDVPMFDEEPEVVDPDEEDEEFLPEEPFEEELVEEEEFFE